MRYLIIFSVGALALCALFYKADDRFKSSVNRAANVVKEDIAISRSRLLSQIEAWNQRAQLQGLHSQQIHIGDPGGAMVAAHAAASGAHGAAGSGSGGGGGSASCACDKTPADTRWPMKSAAEIAEETPELAAALKKAAKDNEVMIALGVICTVPGGCEADPCFT